MKLVYPYKQKCSECGAYSIMFVLSMHEKMVVFICSNCQKEQVIGVGKAGMLLLLSHDEKDEEPTKCGVCDEKNAEVMCTIEMCSKCHEEADDEGQAIEPDSIEDTDT